MNSSITFNDKGLFLLAVTALELDSTPRYSVDYDTMTINTDDVDYLVDLLHEQGIVDFGCSIDGDEHDQFRHDGEADADALRSAGYDDEENYCPSIDSFGGEEY
jgi:hypothetical protein